MKILSETNELEQMATATSKR